MALSVNQRYERRPTDPIGHLNGHMETDASPAAATTIKLGYPPRIVRVKNVTDRMAYEWFSGMSIPSSLKTASSGTVTLETAECIAVGDNEFTIPASIMLASKKLVWEAVG